MKLLYFAKIREILGRGDETISLPPNILSAGDLIDYLMDLDDIYKTAFSDKRFFIAADEEFVEMDFIIKKSAIAINAADARPARFTGGERIDCSIAELDIDKRKATLSIKLLEEIERKDALDKYGSEGSGKNLPFSSLSDDLKKKKKEDE